MCRRGIDVLLASLLALGCGGDGDEAAPAPAAPLTGFVDRVDESGIRFRMSFLPGEQGMKFKINLYDHGCGVAVADVDGDGLDDVYFLNQLGANALYKSKGDGTFTDITEEAGPVTLVDRICTAAVFNDVDNDGDQDLYVTSTRGGNALLVNDGKGRFRDVTKEAGLTWVGHAQGAAFFDADGDGDLDLFVTNTAGWTTDVLHPRDRYYEGAGDLMTLIGSSHEQNVFFRNEGKLRFEEATGEAGLGGVGWGGDIAVFDYDEDGDLDLFVGNMFGKSVLYRNDGKGRFEDVTTDALGKTPWGTVGAKAFDYDGDGRLDLYVVDMHSDMWTPFDYDLETVEPRRKYPLFYGPLADRPGFKAREEVFAEKVKLPYDSTFFGNGLYRNRGAGRFEEVSDQAGAETFWPWGIAAGDFDNDGFEDVFLPSGMGYPWQYWPCPLLMNNGDGTFTNRASEAGIDPPPGGTIIGRLGGRESVRSSRSAAVGDFDGDGRLDLVVNNFNDRPNFYLNHWPQRNWVGFRLRGRTTSRDAVGAIVRIHAGGRARVSQVHAAGGYLAQSSKVVHFGLGDLTSVERCEIQWPGGRVQVLATLAANRVHEITQE